MPTCFDKLNMTHLQHNIHRLVTLSLSKGDALSQISAGIYFVKVQDGKKQYLQKLVVE